MKRYRSTLLPLCAASALLTLTSASRAQETRSQTPSSAPADNYSYVFSDDPMQAGALTPNDPRIVVARRVIRATLIRPRTAFVVEMLKSVEKL